MIQHCYFHHHDDGCGCGHHREETCACGHHHEEEAHRIHGENGHAPDCDCPLCHPHAEYCDVCGESLANCTCKMPDDDTEKAVYLLKNLGCANCAAKMEQKIRALPEVRYANITFATKQLRLAANHQEALLPRIQEICSSIESDVRVVPRTVAMGPTQTAIWNLEGLNRINDGEKLEKAVSEIEGVTSAVFLAGTKQLKVTASSPYRIFPEIEITAKAIDKGLRLTKAPTDVPASATAERGEGKKDIILLICGVLLYGIAVFAEFADNSALALGFYIAAYLLLGYEILFTAGKNLVKGHIMDENFLMSVASLGAFLIGDYKEAVAVVLFFCIGELFEERAVANSRKRIMEAVDMRPETVHLLIGDKITELPAADAVVGDILLIRPGDRIPLDGVVIEGESFIDTAPVTGEPVEVRKTFGDEVISGCINRSAMLKIRVEKVLSESMVSRILDAVEQAAAGKPKIDRFITRFARIYTPCVVALAVLTAVLPGIFTGEWQHWLYTALTFLVISCPCALVLSIPLAYFSGIGCGSRHGILFKGGASLEALKNIKAVVMDKTGTVTKGDFAVKQVIPAENHTAEEVLQLAACAESASTHPIGQAVVRSAKERKLLFSHPQKVSEIAGKGILAELNGKTLLCGSRRFFKEQGLLLPAETEEFYGTEVLVGYDGEFYGILQIADTVKADAVESIGSLKQQGLATVMLTGDREEAAAAVAEEVGMDEYRAALMPGDKLTALGRIRNNHGEVLFVGDGINDAPVLAGADVGAAMGSGADAAIEAADVVFMNSEMKALPLALAIAQKVGRIAAQNVVFALGVKALVMLLGLMGFANMWFAIFADTGVAILCILNSIRILYRKKL